MTPPSVPVKPSRFLVLGYRGSSAARQQVAALGGDFFSVRGLPVPSSSDGPCQLPLLVWDFLLDAPVLWRCGSHRSRRCPSCAAAYRRRVQRVAATGALTRARSGGWLGLATFTGPGNADHLRWEFGRAAHEVCGCESSAPHGFGVWNRQAGRRWNHLRTLLARELPGVKFFRAVEPQQRGVLHLHIVLWTPNPVTRERLRELGRIAGFGCNSANDWQPDDVDPMKIARYVSKYVTKAVDFSGGIPWETLDESTGELTSSQPSYRTWSQSRDFGCTMRQHEDAIRAQRRAWALKLAASDAATQVPDGPLLLDLDLDPGSD